jgi:hypothetical protein
MKSWTKAEVAQIMQDIATEYNARKHALLLNRTVGAVREMYYMSQRVVQVGLTAQERKVPRWALLLQVMRELDYIIVEKPDLKLIKGGKHKVISTGSAIKLIRSKK